MKQTKRPQLIPDIEFNIALGNAIAIERERSIPEPVVSPSFDRDAKIARASYLRVLVGRLVVFLLPRGRTGPVAAPHHSGRDSIRSA